MPLKRYSFVIMYATLLWASYRFAKICKPLVVYRLYMSLYHYLLLLHAVISLPDPTSYDKLNSMAAELPLSWYLV